MEISLLKMTGYLKLICNTMYHLMHAKSYMKRCNAITKLLQNKLSLYVLQLLPNSAIFVFCLNAFIFEIQDIFKMKRSVDDLKFEHTTL